MLRTTKLIIAALATVIALYVLLADQIFPPKPHADKHCVIYVGSQATEVPCEMVHEQTCDSVVMRMPLESKEVLGDHPALLGFANQKLTLRTNLGELLPNNNHVFRSAKFPSEDALIPIYRYDRLQPLFFTPEELDLIQRSDSLWMTCSCSSVWEPDRLSGRVVSGEKAVKKAGRHDLLKVDGSNNLPVLLIETEEAMLVDREKSEMKAAIVHPGGQPEEVNGRIRIRGHTSRSFPKLNFNLYLDRSTDLGYGHLSKQERYVLHGPYGDLSLIRNALTYDIARRMGVKAPDHGVLELVINEKYMGLYHVFTLPHKVDDMTAGIVQIDRDKPNSRRFSALTPQAYNIKHIGASVDTTAVIEAVRNFERKLMEGSMPLVGGDTFVDYFILNELSKNVDAYRLSTYFDVISVNDSLVVVPGTVWDYNMAWAITKSQDGHLPVGWVIDYPENKSGPWRLLSQLPEFRKRLKRRYRELRKQELSDKVIFAAMDEAYREMKPGLERNMKRFPLYEGYYEWPNFQAPRSASHEVGRIKAWIVERLRWMDEMLLDDRRW